MDDGQPSQATSAAMRSAYEIQTDRLVLLRPPTPTTLLPETTGAEA